MKRNSAQIKLHSKKSPLFGHRILKYSIARVDGSREVSKRIYRMRSIFLSRNEYLVCDFYYVNTYVLFVRLSQ